MEGKNMPLVSVVVPCYNHEKYVKETIEGIVNQTYENIELIVIDDGSTDNSVQVIQELANKYKFVFIHRANKGLSATLNEGIILSKGKYFCACASDDVYVLDKIESQVDFMQSNIEYGMCYGNTIQFDNHNNIKKKKVKNPKSGFIFNDLIFRCFVTAPTAFIRSEVLNDLGGFDNDSWMEDWDMWLKISEKYKIAYIDEYFTYYRLHNANISKNIVKMHEAGDYILAKYKKNKLYQKAKRRRDIRYFYAMSRKHKKEAVKLLPNNLVGYINFRVVVGLYILIFLK
jgi:alpha-1,3-rhamnosyltransferase